MLERQMLYNTAIKELSYLFMHCPDSTLLESLFLSIHVVPISWQENDRYKEENLKTKTFQELLFLKDYLHDYNLILLSLDNLVDRYPNNAWPYIFRARALWGIQYYQAAKQDLEKAYAYEPLLLVERLLVETEFFKKNYFEAMSRIQRIITLHPEDGRSYMLRHLIYREFSNALEEPQKTIYLKKSLLDLEKAITLTPKLATKLQPLVENLKRKIGNS